MPIFQHIMRWLENPKSGASPKLTFFVVIPLAIFSLTVVILSFVQQREWHQAENEAKGPKVSMLIESTLVHDGWTHGILEIENRLPTSIEIQSAEVLKPHSLQLAPQDPAIPNTSNGGPIVAKASNVLIFQKTIPAYRPPSLNYTWAADIWLKPYDPKQTRTILVRFNMRETDYPNREWNRDAVAKPTR